MSFLANLVLAFPVILLFYLLVTPEIRETAIPGTMAAVLFLFPLAFVTLFFWSRFRDRPDVLWRNPAAGAAPRRLRLSRADRGLGPDRAAPDGAEHPQHLPRRRLHHRADGVPHRPRPDPRHPDPRLCRGGADPRRRALVHHDLGDPAERPRAADRRCLPRIGYTTILLGTLGFFGLGVSPESPDWGSTINEGRKLLRIYVHPALPPALAIMSLVLGLNLLADALREQAMKD